MVIFGRTSELLLAMVLLLILIVEGLRLPEPSLSAKSKGNARGGTSSGGGI